MAGQKEYRNVGQLPILWWVKLFCILVGVSFGVFYTIPTYMGDPKDWPRQENAEGISQPIKWYHQWAENFLPSNRIALGLDLKGGLHLVLEVDVDKSVQDSLSRALGRAKDLAADKKIKVVSATLNPDKSMVIELENPEQIVEFEKLITGQSGLIIFDKQKSSGNKAFFKSDDRFIEQYAAEIMKQGITTIRNRIDQFGVAEPSIFQQGENRIVVQMPGLADPARAKELIGSTAQLDFRLVLNEVPAERLEEVINEARTALKIAPEDYKSENIRLISQWLRDNKKISTAATVMYNRTYQTEAGVSKLLKATPYLVEATPALTGELIEDAQTQQTTQSIIPEWAVNLKFKPQGAKIFGDLTTKAFEPKNAPNQIAIILDENVNSAPRVNEPILSGDCQITLGRSNDQEAQMKEAQNLAMVLRAGALPATVKIIEERQVGPTEGEENIRKGVLASLISAAIIVLFMLYIYGKTGITTNIALMINVLLILGFLAAFGATLTLPGIAGIALTIGMAVDGNIIINERIREEVRNGLTPKQAFYKGYDSSFTTLLDANLTTAIAGVILLVYGNPSTRGFAVTLLIGIFTTVSTSYYVTEVIGQWLVEKFNLKRI